jgi:hypothetical protein
VALKRRESSTVDEDLNDGGEKDGLPSYDIPEDLKRLYVGSLGLQAPHLYANFGLVT